MAGCTAALRLLSCAAEHLFQRTQLELIEIWQQRTQQVSANDHASVLSKNPVNVPNLISCTWAVNPSTTNTKKKNAGKK